MNLTTILSMFWALLLATSMGCASEEPQKLEYTQDQLQQMDAAMGIDADGNPIGDTEFKD
ncbi:hypothetical protein [Novipirellula rosea]|uniref:EF-hand domain-containing protein n=1 Tax=Novipirellula rosea TaxID=1031540 RepID=A0ABP8NP72_9BACT|tara:strand:+ start:4139 stop:4318 length:180 start_codon:yes stop_codon:yes gene_type:complete